MCSLGRKMLYLEHQIDTRLPSAFLHLWGVMRVRSPDIRFIQLIAINISLKHSSRAKKFDVRICWNYGMQLRACSFLFLDSGWYISVYVIYENVWRHSMWSQSDRLSAYFYRLDTTQMSCNANLELVAIDSQIAHLGQFCQNLDAWQKSGEAISPQETLPCSSSGAIWRCFFSICDYSPVCLPCHLEEKKDKQYETNFEQCHLNLTADQFLWHEEGAFIGTSVFVHDLIPFPFQPMRDLDRNSGDQPKQLPDCTSGFDCLPFENLAGVSLQALWYWNNFMMFLAASSKHLPHPD